MEELLWGIIILSLSLLGIIFIMVGVIVKGGGESGGGSGATTSGESPHTSGDSGIPLLSQPNSTYQFVNSTSEHYLHIFLANPDLKSAKWVIKSGNGKISDPVDWTTQASWDPLGSHLAQELIIPEGKYAILQMPSSGSEAHNILGIKFKDSNSNDFLTLKQGLPENIGNYVDTKQWPILLEGTKDKTADSSAVDGTNFNIEYSFTECTKEYAEKCGLTPDAFPVDGVPDDGIMHTKTIGNACDGIRNDPTKATPALGCINPAKWQTAACLTNADTGYCEPESQNCGISPCGQSLFNLDSDEGKKVAKYECTGTNVSSCTTDDGTVVKPFLNQTYNVENPDLQKFCKAINGEGNFTTYCYDYNDPSSSFTLRYPYKAKLVYRDL